MIQGMAELLRANGGKRWMRRMIARIDRGGHRPPRRPRLLRVPPPDRTAAAGTPATAVRHLA
jgi:hypothetical protein